MGRCEFCAIAGRDAPAEVVYETDTTLAFFPLAPATRGHSIVIPKRHIQDFLHATPDDLTGLSETVLRVGRALEAVLEPQGMNLISSAGEAASQSIMHLHVHLVPRWKGDAVGEIWPPSAPTAEPVLTHIAETIREYCDNEYLADRNPEDKNPAANDDAVEDQPWP